MGGVANTGWASFSQFFKMSVFKWFNMNKTGFMAPMVLEQKPKVRILFSFGYHGNAEHFRRHKLLLDDFNPHVFAPESGGITRQERFEATFNHMRLFKMAQKGCQGQEAAEYAAQLKEGASYSNFPQYVEAQADFISGLSCRLYFLEANEDLSIERRFEKAKTQKEDALLSMAKGGVKEGFISLTRSIIEQEIVAQIRDSQIIENIGKFRDDVLLYYEELISEPEIRVFAPFGLGHKQLIQMAVSAHKNDRTITIEQKAIHYHPSYFVEQELLSISEGKWEPNGDSSSTLYTAIKHEMFRAVCKAGLPVSSMPTEVILRSGLADGIQYFYSNPVRNQRIQPSKSA